MPPPETTTAAATAAGRRRKRRKSHTQWPAWQPSTRHPPAGMREILLDSWRKTIPLWQYTCLMKVLCAARCRSGVQSGTHFPQLPPWLCLYSGLGQGAPWHIVPAELGANQCYTTTLDTTATRRTHPFRRRPSRSPSSRSPSRRTWGRVP